MINVETEFGLGDRVEDIITKFKGITMAATVWFNGCLRWQVVLEKTMDGKQIELWVDDCQLKMIKKGVRIVNVTPTYGPKNDPDSCVSV